MSTDDQFVFQFQPIGTKNMEGCAQASSVKAQIIQTINDEVSQSKLRNRVNFCMAFPIQ